MALDGTERQSGDRRDLLERELPRRDAALRYRVLDVDIFGEELEQPPYADVERIAAVGAVITRN